MPIKFKNRTFHRTQEVLKIVGISRATLIRRMNSGILANDLKTIEEIGTETYEGEVKLVLPSLVGFDQLRQFEEHVKQVENLKIAWTGGSHDEGSIIAVSVQKPMTLIRILNEMPIVQEVQKKGESIVVMLKSPVGNSEDY